MSIIPYVVEQTGRGERSYDIFSRLLSDRIIFLGEEVTDASAGTIIGGIYDNRLLVKKTKAALELMPAAICELPYDGAKEMLPVDEVDSKELLTKLFIVMYDELPVLKRKNNEIK